MRQIYRALQRVQLHGSTLAMRFHLSDAFQHPAPLGYIGCVVLAFATADVVSRMNNCVAMQLVLQVSAKPAGSHQAVDCGLDVAAVPVFSSHFVLLLVGDELRAIVRQRGTLRHPRGCFGLATGHRQHIAGDAQGILPNLVSDQVGSVIHDVG